MFLKYSIIHRKKSSGTTFQAKKFSILTKLRVELRILTRKNSKIHEKYEYQSFLSFSIKTDISWGINEIN